MTDKDCKTCSYGWRPKGINTILCSRLYECKGGSLFKDDVETLKTLLKEAGEVLEYYKNLKLPDNLFSANNFTWNGKTEFIKANIKIDTQIAEEMIKKIDEVL